MVTRKTVVKILYFTGLVVIVAFAIKAWQVNQRLAEVKERNKQALQLASDLLLSEGKSLNDISANLIYLAKIHAPEQSETLTKMARIRLDLPQLIAASDVENVIAKVESLTKDGDHVVAGLKSAKLSKSTVEHLQAVQAQWALRINGFASAKDQYEKALAEYQNSKKLRFGLTALLLRSQ